MRSIICAVFGGILTLAIPASASADPGEYAAKLRGQCFKRDLGVAERIVACGHAIDVKQFQGKDLAELYLTRSGLHFANHERDQVLPDLDEALHASPDIVPEVVGRAANYRDRKEYDLALEHLDRADKVQPGNWMVLYVRASVHLRRNETDLAAKDAASAGEAKPNDVYIQGLQVAIKALAGNTDDALSLADRIVAQHPDSEAAYNERCYLRALLGRDLDKALDDCNMAMKLKPGTAALLDSRGFVYLKLGRYQESIADYSAAIRFADHPPPTSFYGRALAEQKTGNTIGATADIQAADMLSPGIEKKFDTLAILAE